MLTQIGTKRGHILAENPQSCPIGHFLSFRDRSIFQKVDFIGSRFSHIDDAFWLTSEKGNFSLDISLIPFSAYARGRLRLRWIPLSKQIFDLPAGRLTDVFKTSSAATSIPFFFNR
jgi:hypothetical protein